MPKGLKEYIASGGLFLEFGAGEATKLNKMSQHLFVLKDSTDIHVLLRMNCNNSDEPLDLL